MKFAIAKEHKDFYQAHGRIEFEGLLSSEQVRLFNQAIDDALAAKMEIPPSKIRHLTSEELFLQGHDLWRHHSELRKLVCQPKLAEIASQLVDKKPIRLAYDQLLPSRYQSPLLQPVQPQLYSSFLDQTSSLDSTSCIRGLLCGVIIALSSLEEPIEEEPGIPSLFPKEAGHMIFLNPEKPLNWSQLYQFPGKRFYLIAYCQAQSFYEPQLQDPHAHELKQLGYIFNDRLSDKKHPILYR